jgi:hypothetical protein
MDKTDAMCKSLSGRQAQAHLPAEAMSDTTRRKNIAGQYPRSWDAATVHESSRSRHTMQRRGAPRHKRRLCFTYA